MASLNEPGEIKLIAESPTGRQFVVWSGRSDGPVNAGKSPDGVLANLTADKQLYLPIGGPVMTGGWKVKVNFTSDSTDGLDASDSVFIIPLTFDDGTRKELNRSDLGFTTDITATANNPQDLGTGYTIPNGTRAKLGGGPFVISIEDDTA